MWWIGKLLKACKMERKPSAVILLGLLITPVASNSVRENLSCALFSICCRCIVKKKLHLCMFSGYLSVSFYDINILWFYTQLFVLVSPYLPLVKKRYWRWWWWLWWWSSQWKLWKLLQKKFKTHYIYFVQCLHM